MGVRVGERSTVDSMPVREVSRGFREGGERGIVRIEEEGGKGTGVGKGS